MNPLLRDRDVEFLMNDVLDVHSLLRLPYFAEHDGDTVALFLGAARRLARESLFPSYKPMDEAPPRFEQGRVFVHAHMKARGTHCLFHYLPLNASPMGQQCGGRAASCPVSERASDELARLPFFTAMTEGDQSQVIEAALAFRA